MRDHVQRLHVKAKVSYKLILLFPVAMARYASSTNINKFTISYQYLEKEVRDKFDFLHADKPQCFLQADTQTSPKNPNNKFTMSCLSIFSERGEK